MLRILNIKSIREMNHPTFKSVNWSMLIIGIALIIGAHYASEDAKGLLIFIGAVFAAINGGMIAYRSFVTKRVEQLLQHGQLIQAKFQQVEINTSIQVNGASPFRVVAQWHDTRNNEVRVYKSANLWFNPAQFVEDRTIPVYVDLNNPTKYHMDLSFLPKVTGLA